MFSFRLTTLTLLAASLLPAADQALLSLVSPDSKVVGGMNVARAVSSPLGQFLLSKMNADDPGFREFTTVTGFDPRRDLRDVIFASTSERAPHGAGIVAARGVFNGPQILAAAKAKGGTAVQYKGVEIVQKNNGGIAVVDGSLLLAGTVENVKLGIDRQTVSALPPSPIFQKASALMSRFDAWTVTNVPASQFATAAPKRHQGPINPAAFQGILETSGGAIFDSIVTIEGEALTRSDKDAQALIDVVRFMLSFMQMNGNNPEMKKLEPILNSLEMKAEASTVKFSLRVPEADLEQLLKPRRAAAAKRAAIQ